VSVLGARKGAVIAMLAVAVACGGAARIPQADARPAREPSRPSGTRAAVRPVSAARARSGRVLWGALFGGKQYGLGDAPWTMEAAATFEREVGKQASLVHFMLPWSKCYTTCVSVPFPTRAMTAIRDAGKIPVLGWNSYSQPISPTEPQFQLSDVIRGRFDSFIRGWATSAKRWGHPFFLVFDREMNLNCCYPYVEGRNGNTDGQFVAMWRHVAKIFARVGATNVTWVWDPNVSYAGAIPFRRVYPGNAYVNWTGLDGYNWGTNPYRRAGWRSFTRVFGVSYDSITTGVAPRKPMMVVETASTESGGSKAAWINNMLTSAMPHRFPKIRALMYYNYEINGMGWRIESSRAATAAFATGIKLRRYAGAKFSRVARSPISPPS
jgi:hypothetical protein